MSFDYTKNMSIDYAKNMDIHAFSTPVGQQKGLSSTAYELIDEIYTPYDSFARDSFQEVSERSSQIDQPIPHFVQQSSHFFDMESESEQLEQYGQCPQQQQWTDNQYPLELQNAQECWQQEQPNHHECEEVIPQENEVDVLILNEDNDSNMVSLFGQDAISVISRQHDQFELHSQQQLWEEESIQKTLPQAFTSSDIKQESTDCQSLSEQPSNLENNRQKRLKKKNCMGNNSCEETKNFFNHIVPFIEKNIDPKWIQLLKTFKKKGNHKSLRFLDDLAEEVHTLDQQNKEEFIQDFEHLIKYDVRIWAMNHIKLETTFVILKYSDALITVMNNPRYFTSIKKAKEAHSALQNRQQI